MVKEASKLTVGKSSGIELLEFLAKVLLQGITVADIVAIGVLQLLQLGDEVAFDLGFSGGHTCNPELASSYPRGFCRSRSLPHSPSKQCG